MARRYHRHVGGKPDTRPGPVRVVDARPRLWQITAPHFCAGLVVTAGKVARAAPILAWAMGREWRKVRAYAQRKGWHGQLVQIQR